MPSINDFFAKFGWPEIFFTVLIAVVIVGIREWKYIRRTFAGKKDDKKEYTHSEE